MSESKGTATFDDSASASITTLHMNRTSTAYIVNENELDSLVLIDVGSSTCTAIITFCLSMIGAATWDLGYTPSDNASGRFGYGWCIMWAFVAVAAGLFWWFVIRKQKMSFIDRIKRESQPSTGD